MDALLKAHQANQTCPSPIRVADFFMDVLGLLFPAFTTKPITDRGALDAEMSRLQQELDDLLNTSPELCEKATSAVSSEFFQSLPTIQGMLQQDAEALFAGDPAATNVDEVVRTYPGFYAVAAYRIAHQLWKQCVPLYPRIITEHAHSKAGIDIHPGAEIGQRFCIDHGTGVVIGETTHIGNNVKVYQGVTLGALSVEKSDAKTKRHPTIEDNVVLYSGATILGGETVIGHDSIIGGNVWITRSIPPNSTVYYKAQLQNKETKETDLFVIKNNQ